MVVHAGCDKQRFTDVCRMAMCDDVCGKLHGGERSQLFSHSTSHLSDSQIFVENHCQFLPTLPAFDAAIRGFPSKYCNNFWRGKTRMVWLPDGEKFEDNVYLF